MWPRVIQFSDLGPAVWRTTLPFDKRAVDDTLSIVRELNSPDGAQYGLVTKWEAC
jgi:hypothetical protein